MSKLADIKTVVREDREYDRVVLAEMLIPEVANVFGDYWTAESIREAAYLYMREGFAIDVEHDNIDRTGSVYLVESFIARPGDPDFIEGSWVVGIKIDDDALWEDVLEGRINGFSHETLVAFLPAILTMDDDGVRTGVTEPDEEDGHVHTFMVTVDDTNRPISGGTDVVNGHHHVITKHTVTSKAAGHVHRYNLVTGKDGK